MAVILLSGVSKLSPSFLGRAVTAFYPITGPDHEGKSTRGKAADRPARADAPILRWKTVELPDPLSC
jgi:hypothetical protein